MTRALIIPLLLAALSFGALPAHAQSDGPLRIEITEGVIEPLPFAVPDFVPETGGAGELARNIARVVAEDLSGTGLFREVPREAHIGSITSFSSPVEYSDWKAINAEALITGAVTADASGRVNVKFRVHDVFSNQELGDGLQFSGTEAGWRRMAHKVADTVYSRITGESGYFDSRGVFVSEQGPKDDREKRLAVIIAPLFAPPRRCK